MTTTATTNWHALPLNANWYGEVVFTLDGETDYNYGYALTTTEPGAPTQLVPEGAEVIEWTVRKLPYKSGDVS